MLKICGVKMPPDVRGLPILPCSDYLWSEGLKFDLLMGSNSKRVIKVSKFGGPGGLRVENNLNLWC